MTNEEPIFRIKSSTGQCYLRPDDWTNNPRLNTFQVGVVTYQQDYPHNDGHPRTYVSKQLSYLYLIEVLNTDYSFP